MLVLVQRFADQAALALTQARRREAQAEAAELHRRLERSLLPNLELRNRDLTVIEHSLPGERRLAWAVTSSTCWTSTSGGVGVIVGDVAGHGPDAAALGATLRSAWGALVVGGAQPADVARTLRQVIERERTSPDTYATCCLAWIDPERDQVSILNFGHPVPLLLGAPGDAAGRAAADAAGHVRRAGRRAGGVEAAAGLEPVLLHRRPHREPRLARLLGEVRPGAPHARARRAGERDGRRPVPRAAAARHPGARRRAVHRRRHRGRRGQADSRSEPEPEPDTPSVEAPAV